MRTFLITVATVTLALSLSAQNIRTAKLTELSTLPQVLNFEDQQSVGAPAGWTSSPEQTVSTDNKIMYSGHWAARLERKTDSPGGFSTMHQAIPIGFGGKTVELRGFLRMEDVTGFAGFWMREEDDRSSIAFDNMQSRQLKGTADWTEYSVTLPVKDEGTRLYFGVLLVGTGRVWADDLQLLVDGKPVWEVPKAEHKKTIVELDQGFDGGSGISLTGLSQIQIDNLATLGRVWGFLKYHHPLVTAGKLHWDYELFRVLPEVLQAGNRAAANHSMLKWMTKLGAVAPCTSCAKIDESRLQFRPDVSWIEDQTMLGADLSKALQVVYQNRLAEPAQFYVATQSGVGNPVFKHELAYENAKLPDAGFQLLALYRFWNIIEYWFPYRDVLGEKWDKVLAEFIPRITLAKDGDEYKRELIALIARAHDSHANLWSSLKVRPPTGDCQFPVTIRFVGNRAVVTELAGPEGQDSGMAVGDVITELDGVAVSKLVERWTPYYAASNDDARLRDIARWMTRGNCGEANARILRGSRQLLLKPKRVSGGEEARRSTHDLPGETFRMLSKDVAYLKLSSVKAADAAHYVEAASGAKGLVIDIRNYPSEFVVFVLGGLLVDKETPFVRFTFGDLATPGAFSWSQPLSIKPGKPHFAGKVMILVDETTQSSAEYTTMAFRAAGGMVVGSTTAGADGNVSQFSLPGGLSSRISGIGVFYPDKKPTQRIGIVPDIEVRPTVAGIQSGRDEVLEVALRQILGDQTPAAEIESLARPSAASSGAKR
jgi:C-terminal processing protease CtpA/Prc